MIASLGYLLSGASSRVAALVALESVPGSCGGNAFLASVVFSAEAPSAAAEAPPIFKKSRRPTRGSDILSPQSRTYRTPANLRSK